MPVPSRYLNPHCAGEYRGDSLGVIIIIIIIIVIEITFVSQFDLNCAGEHQGDKLGLYHLTTDPTEESSRCGLVYKQFHCGQVVKEVQFYLYRWELLKLV